MNASRRGMAIGYLVVGLGLAAAGLAVFTAQVLEARSTIRDRIGGFHRLEIGTSEVLSLDRSGAWTIFLEHDAVEENRGRQRPASMECLVVLAETGEALSLKDLLAGEPNVDPSLFAKGLADPEREVEDVYVYSLEGRAGHSSWTFVLEQPADVRVTTALDAGEVLEPGLVLAVGQGEFREMLSGTTGLYRGAAIMTFCITGGAILLVIGYMRSAPRTARSSMPPPSSTGGAAVS
ncbi:hypothetical protein [Mucisphaera sp.]|uniref:hypothetical protein n=1 Tax=Mucisphaera sp. TaxID=2913024 RepID=UPI003D0DEF16